jgi:hypothetical protein
VSVIPFPSAAAPDLLSGIMEAQPSNERLRGIEQCLAFLAAEAEEMGLELVAHFIAVAHEAARECRAEGLG